MFSSFTSLESTASLYTNICSFWSVPVLLNWRPAMIPFPTVSVLRFQLTFKLVCFELILWTNFGVKERTNELALSFLYSTFERETEEEKKPFVSVRRFYLKMTTKHHQHQQQLFSLGHLGTKKCALIYALQTCEFLLPPV